MRHVGFIPGVVLILVLGAGGRVRAEPSPTLPESLVDYLKSRGEAFDFAARRSLYRALVSESERYRGHAGQNVRLRNTLVARDHAPRVAAGADHVAEGAGVVLHLGRSWEKLLVESDLAASSSAQEGREVRLGAARAGVFSFRLVGPRAFTEGTLVLLPEENGLSLTVTTASRPVIEAELAARQLDASLEEGDAEGFRADLVRLPEATGRFFAAVEAADLREHLGSAFEAYTRSGGAVDLSKSAVVCTLAVGTSAAGVVSAPFWRECGAGLVGNAKDLLLVLLRETIGALEREGRLAAADAGSLRTGLLCVEWIDGVYGLVDAARSKESLRLAEKSLGLLRVGVEQMEEGPLKLVLANGLAEGQKAILLLRTGGSD